MSNFWFNLIGFILFVFIFAGGFLFALGLEKPNKKKDEGTYNTLKWVGISLLITGGVGMLIWLYFNLRPKKINPGLVNSYTRDLPKSIPGRMSVTGYASNKGVKTRSMLINDYPLYEDEQL
jgi:hypothetical protein